MRLRNAVTASFAGALMIAGCAGAPDDSTSSSEAVTYYECTPNTFETYCSSWCGHNHCTPDGRGDLCNVNAKRECLESCTNQGCVWSWQFVACEGSLCDCVAATGSCG